MVVNRPRGPLRVVWKNIRPMMMELVWWGMRPRGPQFNFLMIQVPEGGVWKNIMILKSSELREKLVMRLTAGGPSGKKHNPRGSSRSREKQQDSKLEGDSESDGRGGKALPSR